MIIFWIDWIGLILTLSELQAAYDAIDWLPEGFN